MLLLKNLLQSKYRALSMLLVVLIATPCLLLAQTVKPAWADYQRRSVQFPKNDFVVGFVSEQQPSDETVSETLERLKGAARTQLVESIHVSIKSMTTTTIVNENTVTSDYFKQTSVSLSKVSISGLTEETWYDEKEENSYAIAYARKSDISTLYKNTIVNKKSAIEQKIQNAELLAASGDNQGALKNYFESIPLFREVEEAQTLIIYFENRTTDDEVLQVATINDLKMKVENGIKSQLTNPLVSLDDICYFMAYGLKVQLQGVDKDIRLASFTYRDSKMSSMLSQRFSQAFEQKLVQQGVQVGAMVYEQNNRQLDESKMCLLAGTFWDEGDNIKIIAIVRDMENGKAIASIEGNLPISWLKNQNIAYIPSSYNVVNSDHQIVNNAPEIAEGGVLVDINTNRGAENPYFTHGDTMVLYVKANQPCYLRVIYFDAQGNKLLLIDNYYISESMVNTYIQIPHNFVCVAPFGVETLQLNAQSDKFEALSIKYVQGFRFILENVTELETKLRSFIIADENDVVAEKRLMITTLPKY